MKFYAEQGSYDLVGNNTPVFFVRDPMKFPHFIRSQKRLPDSGVRDSHMQWDFRTSNRDMAHQVTYLKGERGLPRTWCQMNGYGSHTYMSLNAPGEKFWSKYHFRSNQGLAFFSNTLYVNFRSIEKLYPVELRLPGEVGLTGIPRPRCT
jgi:catalase